MRYELRRGCLCGLRYEVLTLFASLARQGIILSKAHI